jgi:hypothetical protein
MALDLSRIEAWTREMLEGEARRRSIRSPEFRTRGDLVRLILRHQYGDRLSAGRERIAQGRRNLARARELLGAAVGAALTGLPEPFDALLRLRSRLPEATPPPRAPRPAAPAAPVAQAAPPSPVAEPPPAVPVEVERPAPVPVPVPPAREVPTTRTFIEEPIRTRSMARLLAAQGLRERALAIYAELLAREPGDQALQDEAAAIGRGDPVEAPVLPERPAGALPVQLPASADRLQSEGDTSTGLLLRWQISEAGQQRARAVLGTEGELAVRLISIRSDADRQVRSEVTEHGPVAASGEWQTPPLPPGVRCFAAAGLRSGERFVAIVHVHPGGRAERLSERPSASA